MAQLQELGNEVQGFRPTVYWYPSFRCNLACRHCWVDSSPKVDTTGDLSTADMLLVVEQIIELNAASVIFSGGEALYRPDVVFCSTQLVKAGVSVFFESNGLVFKDDFVRLWQASRVEGAGAVGVTISLDGGTAEAHDYMRGKGSFAGTLKGMQFLVDNGVYFDVQCIVNRKNIDTLTVLADEMLRFRPYVRSLQFGFLHPVGRGDYLAKNYGMTETDYPRAYELVETLKSSWPGKIVIKVPPALLPAKYALKLLNKTGSHVSCTTSCAFPTLGVLNNGAVSICALTRKDSGVLFGNVRDSRLIDIWKAARLDIMRANYLSAEGLQGICGDCIFRDSCKGSCRAYAFENAGDFNAAHPLCQQLADEGRFPRQYLRSAVAKKMIPAVVA